MILYNEESSKYLLSLKPSKSVILIVATIIICLFVLCTINISTYDVNKVIGYVSCKDSCSIKITSSIEASADFKNIKELKIDNNIHAVKDVTISDIQVDNETKTNYQVINIEIEDINIQDNMFYDIYLYQNKDLIIKKIYNQIIKEA